MYRDMFTRHSRVEHTRWVLRYANQIFAWPERIARRKVVMCLLFAAVTMGARMALLRRIPIPQPYVSDEFGSTGQGNTQWGRVMVDRDWPIEILKTDPGKDNAFTFYISNYRKDQFVEAQLKDSVVVSTIGDPNRRTSRLTQPQGPGMQLMYFSPYVGLGKDKTFGISFRHHRLKARRRSGKQAAWGEFATLPLASLNRTRGNGNFGRWTPKRLQPILESDLRSLICEIAVKTRLATAFGSDRVYVAGEAGVQNGNSG